MGSSEPEPTVHATAVVFRGRGLLIRGASGAGKSRLAYALIEAGPEAALVGDDRMVLWPRGGILLARAAKGLEGLIELRGAGILKLDHHIEAPIALAVDLAPIDAVERLPERWPGETSFQGVNLPAITVPIGDLAHQMLLVRTAVDRLP